MSFFSFSRHFFGTKRVPFEPVRYRQLQSDVRFVLSALDYPRIDSLYSAL